MSATPKYDAILIFGSGINEDGSLPDSSVACVQKAIELHKNNPDLKLITCGKWAHQLTYTPPCSEAEALRRKAVELGFPAKHVYVEDKSVTTVSNACLAKVEYLEKHHLRRVALISVHPQAIRAFYNLKYVLGTHYMCVLISADFTYPPDKKQELEAAEREKQLEAQAFLNPLPLGDHAAIFNAAMADLKANYKPKPL